MPTASDVTVPRATGSDGLTVGVEECPEPIRSERHLSPYKRLIERALELPPAPDVTLVVRISTWSRPERSLSLSRTRDGKYVLRSIRLLKSDWWVEGRHVLQLDDRAQAHALADVKVAREVHERFLDSSTANLLLTLWASALLREQVADTSPVEVVTMDGTSYSVLTGLGAVSTSNPDGALGIAVSSVRRLEEIVVDPSPKDCARLEAAVAEMAEALHRIRNNGPCRRRH